MIRSQQEQVKKRAQLMRDELGESFDHAMRAAGHAASGVKAASAQVRPTADRFREAASQRWDATVTAFNDAAVNGDMMSRSRMRRRGGMAALGGRKATRAVRKQEGGRWPRLAMLLAAGAAVGAIGAMVMRRRRQQQWAEYDPNEALEAVGASAAMQAEAGIAGVAPPESALDRGDVPEGLSADEVVGRSRSGPETDRP